MDDDANVLIRAAGAAPARYSRLALASFISAVIAMAGLLLGPIAQPLVVLVLLFVPAIAMGHLARRQFRRAPGQFRNESMATFGLNVGYLCLFLNVVAVAALIWLSMR